MTKYAFSFDRQDWNNGLYESRNIAIIVAVNAYKTAVEREQKKTVDSILLYLGEAEQEVLPQVDSQMIVDSLRKKMKTKVGEAAKTWFDPSLKLTLDYVVNDTVQKFVKEHKQEPKYFSVSNVEEYEHKGQPVATLQDLGTIIKALTINQNYSPTTHQDDALKQWESLKNQLTQTMEDLKVVFNINAFASAIEITNWDGLDIPEKKWDAIQSLVFGYFTDQLALQEQILELQKQIIKE